MTTALLLLALATAETPATKSETPTSAYHLDAEVDPTAYVMSGYSGHVGLGRDHVRLDVGFFAMKIPQFFHGDDGFDAKFDGVGAKLQYFFGAEQTGFFTGIDAGYTRIHATLKSTGVTDTQHTADVGVDAGYRFALPAGFYVTPWLGVGYSFGTREVVMGGGTFKMSPVTIFPAIHLGYRFL